MLTALILILLSPEKDSEHFGTWMNTPSYSCVELLVVKYDSLRSFLNPKNTVFGCFQVVKRLKECLMVFNLVMDVETQILVP